MRVHKNLFGTNGQDKIDACEIAVDSNILLNIATLPYRGRYANNIDWNALPTGWYRVGLNTNYTPNFPPGAYGYGILVVLQATADNKGALQIYFSDGITNTALYWRTSYNGTFRPWKSVWNS